MSDHLAEARGLAAYAAETHAGPEVALMFAAQAQVHATLYLAEQQRLANLIAFMDGYDKPVRGAFIRYHGDRFGEVTKGIGIT